MAEKIRIKPQWDPLTQRSTEALNAGMTYGKYMAQRYEAGRSQREARERAFQEHKESRKKETGCRWCGGAVPNGGKYGNFCCLECRKKWEENEQASRERGAVKDESERSCVYCGQKLDGRKKLYCNARCAYLHNQDSRRERRNEQYAVERKPRICKFCGSIITDPSRLIYCDDLCKKAEKARKIKEQRDRGAC